MALTVKVCGLTEPARVDQACAGGAGLVGFVFFPPSARCLRPDLAAMLSARVPDGVRQVGVFVDPSDDELDTVLAHVPLDVIQLHGSETPERAAAVGLRTGCRVMKALRIEEAADVEIAHDFEEVVDLLLFDAKPPRGEGVIPGGNGLPFDWRLLAGRRWQRPWALAGGVDATNLEVAVRLLHPPLVDISSGVEVRPGIKDPERLDAFLTLAARLGREPPAPEPACA
jgi:phosphoribosylanthranilate isomerase